MHLAQCREKGSLRPLVHHFLQRRATSCWLNTCYSSCIIQNPAYNHPRLRKWYLYYPFSSLYHKLFSQVLFRGLTKRYCFTRFRVMCDTVRLRLLLYRFHTRSNTEKTQFFDHANMNYLVTS